MPKDIPEITYQYVIHCDDCGLLYINYESANPNESDPDNYPTTTDTLDNAKRSVAAHKRYHANA